MNNEILLSEFKYSIEIKDFDRAYKILCDMIKYDITDNFYKNKTALVVLYFEFLIKHNCYMDLQKIYNKLHNRCVYYRNGCCFGQKGAPRTKCKGNRGKCEQ